MATQYSRLEEEEKEKASRAWERRWNVFVEAVSLYCDMFV